MCFSRLKCLAHKMVADFVKRASNRRRNPAVYAIAAVSAFLNERRACTSPGASLGGARSLDVLMATSSSFIPSPKILRCS